MTLSNDAKAIITLTTRLGSRSRPSLTPRMWNNLDTVLRDSGHEPSDFFDRGFDLRDVPGVSADLADRVDRLLDDGAAATLEADDLSGKGIWMMTLVDEGYPSTLVSRLGPDAPPVLFGVGTRSLLQANGVGIVGSRNVDEPGAKVAASVAEEVVRAGRSVVSGAARGVDQLAMNAAYSRGGTVIGVLADSLIGRIQKSGMLEALDSEATCLISQQAPSSGFTPASAMSRNKLIYALSDVTVVIASDSGSGGTWSGATEAIKSENGRVVVWRGSGEGPGNSELQNLGAPPLRDASKLGSFLEQNTPEAEQLSLIDGG